MTYGVLVRVSVSLTVAAVFAAAQTTSAEILGTVTDASGAVVPNAQVTLLRVATGEQRSTITSSNGDYSFPLIDIGEYNVRVSAAGANRPRRAIMAPLTEGVPMRRLKKSNLVLALPFAFTGGLPAPLPVEAASVRGWCCDRCCR